METSRRVLILQHTDTTTPGHVPDLLARAGHHFTLGQLHRGFVLPAPRDFDAIVVCGGGVHVHQDEQFPFLKPEKEFLKRAIDEGVLTMGLCLGAQLIAITLGAKCYPHEGGWEVGWHEVECRAVDGVAGFETPARRRVSQYHRYVFDLPAGAKLLASNEWVPTQAFQWEKHVLAFGFHPERTRQSNAEIAREIGLPTTGRTQKPAEMLALGPEHEPAVTRWFDVVLRGFVNR